MNEEEFLSSVDSVRGWMRLTHARWFWDNAHAWTRAAELGSYCGRSSCAAGLAIKNSGARARYWCVDTFDPPTHRNCFDEFANNIKRFNLDDVIVPIIGDTHDLNVLKRVPSELDFLYIDAAHDYASVKDDIYLWVPKVRTGGTVMFHDYCDDLRRYSTGVKQAVDEAIDMKMLGPAESIDDEACVVCVKLAPL